MQNAKLQFTFRQKICSKQAIQKFRFFPFTCNFQLVTFNFWRSQSGQSLVEILIAIGLTGILLPALLTGLVSSREGKAQEGQRLQATALVRESEEAIRSIREKGWTNISANGTYDVAVSGSEWILAPCPCSPVNGFSRQVVIADAQRDSNGQIVGSGGATDPSTKKVTASVSWQTPSTSSVETTSYYQRYLGNTAWTQTTDADFNAGTHNNTQTVGSGSSASVELTQSVGGGTDYGNKFRLTATSAIGTMTNSNTRTALKFTAQGDKTVNAIRVYLHNEVGTSPNYRYGIQGDSAGLPSGNYLCSNTLTATSAGWKTISLTGCPALTAGNVYYIVVQYNSGTVSGSRYVALRRSAPLNNLYPKTNNPDPNADTLFATNQTNWTAQGFQPIYELDFQDSTYEGNPYESSAEVAVFGNTQIGEKFTYTGSTQAAESITFYVRKQGTPAGNLDFVVQQIGGSSTTCTVNSSQVGTSNAPVTCTFGSPITLTQGTQYRVYLRSTSSASGNDYRLYRLVNTSAANYNSINYDATNSIYTISTNGGSSWSDSTGANPNWDIGGFYFTISGSASYPSSGQFTSQVSPNIGNVAFNNITWTASTPAGTSISLEVSINGAPYVGPFSVPTSIPLPNITGSTIRFRANFTSGGSQTPTLNDVSINYSP